MANLNKVMLIGRLGQEPELKDVNNSQVANFSIATNNTWKDDSGQKQEKTEWHNCSAWGNLANLIVTYLHKGSQVYAEGSIETQTYEKDGETRYATKIKVYKIEFLDSKNSEQDNQQNTDYQQKSSVEMVAEARTDTWHDRTEDDRPVNDQLNIKRIQEKFGTGVKDDIPF